MYGIKKSAETITKLQKLVYIYEYDTKKIYRCLSNTTLF